MLNSTKIDELKKDDKITVISVNGDWAYIYSEKNAGWVFADNVESIKNNKNESQTGDNDTNNSTNSTDTNTNESVNSVSDSNSTNTANTISSSNSVNGADDTNSTNNSNTSTNSNATNSDSNKSNTANSSSNKSNTSTSSNVKYPATMYVNVDAAYIRSSASADSDKVTSVGKNCPVTVLSKDGDWYKVEVSEGKGYMKASLLSIDKK